MPRKPFHSELLKLATKALAAGGTQTAPGRVEWDVSRNCEAPQVRELYARPETAKHVYGPTWRGTIVHRDGVKEPVQAGRRAARAIGRADLTIVPNQTIPITVVLWTRCRRCRRCRMARRNMWALKAKAEVQLAARTWFGTLTLNPDATHLMLSRARQDLVRSGIDYEMLPQDEQFKLRHAEISKELTKYVKRLRAEGRGRLRYLLVAEAHKSGLPHYHMLIHEVDAIYPMGERLLRKQWQLGFSQWKLVQDQAQATYLCKYLNKSSLARVRASNRYGQGTVFDHSHPHVDGVQCLTPNSMLTRRVGYEL